MSTKYFGKRIKYRVGGKIYEGLVSKDSPFSEEFAVARDVKVGELDRLDWINEKDVIEQLN